MSIEPDDWRLADDKEYLRGLSWHWSKWRCSRPGWDHDHCSFCWVKISDQDLPGSLSEGYTTFNEYEWVCEECFKDFRAMFAFHIEGEPGPHST